MARIRTIRPEFWDSQKLGQLSVLARLTFVGLISLSDDEGRGRGQVQYLYSRLHPYAKDVSLETFAAAMVELAGVGLATLYQVDGYDYYELPGFIGQQRIDRPSKSSFPNPPQFKDSSNVRRTLDESSTSPRGTLVVGREGKGREGILTTAAAPQPSPSLFQAPIPAPSAPPPRLTDAAKPKTPLQVLMDGLCVDYFGADPASTLPSQRKKVSALYRRFGRAARDILALVDDDPKKAREAVDAIGRWLEGRGLTWTLDTICKWVVDYQTKPEAFRADQARRN